MHFRLIGLLPVCSAVVQDGSRMSFNAGIAFPVSFNHMLNLLEYFYLVDAVEISRWNIHQICETFIIATSLSGE